MEDYIIRVLRERLTAAAHELNSMIAELTRRGIVVLVHNDGGTFHVRIQNGDDLATVGPGSFPRPMGVPIDVSDGGDLAGDRGVSRLPTARRSDA